MNLEDWLIVAKIGKAVGLMGECKLYSSSDFNEPFSDGSILHLDQNRSLTIQHFNTNREVVKFKEINSREDVQKLTNKLLYMSKEKSLELCELSKNQYFWFDIIGAIVKEDDLVLGEVVDIERIVDNDYLVLKTDIKLIEKKLPKRFYVPYIDRYILEFDKQMKILYSQGAYDILEAS